MKNKKLITSGIPDERFVVPLESDFEAQGEFIEANDCHKIATAIIAKYKCFESIKESAIVYLWKRKGSSKPKLLMGKCNKPTGLLDYFSAADFVIYFSANNCRDIGITNFQMEALIFHELKHAAMDDGEPIIVPHDWEGFAEEIENYGLWSKDLKPIADAIATTMQLPFKE